MSTFVQLSVIGTNDVCGYILNKYQKRSHYGKLMMNLQHLVFLCETYKKCSIFDKGPSWNRESVTVDDVIADLVVAEAEEREIFSILFENIS